MKVPRTGRRAKPARDKEPAAAKEPHPTGATSESAREAAELAAVLRFYDLTEIEVERGGARILVRRNAAVRAETAAAASTSAPVAAAPNVPAPVAPASIVASPAPAVSPTPKVETSDGNVSYITSPFVGTFYRSPGPESAPFVDEGTRVRKGQVLCIVEAMKLMNEIESEVDGAIVQILVESGQPVEYGEPLFKIKQG
jgi:acetyl-CoA carboxylase biotin carboxyl carrier protein